jgi:hypothetical protein
VTMVMSRRPSWRGSLTCAPGAPAPPRGTALLSDEIWASEASQAQNWQGRVWATVGARFAFP